MALVLAISAMVSISLLAIVAYAGVFAIAAVRTAWQRKRPDPLAAELDRFLDDVLRARVPDPHEPARPR